MGWLEGIMLACAGGVAGALAYWARLRLAGESLGQRADSILAGAVADSERIHKEAEVDAREKALAVKHEQEAETKRVRDTLAQQEKRLRQKESNLERKSDALDERDSEIRTRESQAVQDSREAQSAKDEAAEQHRQAQDELQRVAGLTREEAHRQLVEAIADKARKEAALKIGRIEEDARNEASSRATKIIASAMQRLAGEFVAEKTVSVVELPSDDMKGRIIGREGRNIRAFEAATGIDVIIDDTPEVVMLSGFNPVRREIAKMALIQLVADGRVHPARIEEVVEKVKDEFQEVVQGHGEQASFDLGLHAVHPELLLLVGKLNYRVTNSQNLWNHSVETAHIAGLLAAELGISQQMAKRAGLLHDIGKAVDHEMEGHHAEVGAEQARRFGEVPEIVEAIRHHHNDALTTVLSTVVQTADILSQARPGARQEVMGSYIRRLEHLEGIASDFSGVQEAQVVQAGREVRVVVGTDDTTDQEALVLSAEIARKIEKELTYPGEVKVTVIREARAVEIAH